MKKKLGTLLEKLTGQPVPIQHPEAVEQICKALTEGKKIGYSQFNELLLSLGYDRVNNTFFYFLCDHETFIAELDIYEDDEFEDDNLHEIESEKQLEEGIKQFRILALLLFGNIKFGFKALSNNKEEFLFWVKKKYKEIPDKEYRSRQEQLLLLREIVMDDTYLLGYLSQDDIDKRLEKNKNDTDAKILKDKSERVIGDGRWNQNVFLTSDHLDVYIATSMREQHEFVFVNQFIKRLSESNHISNLKLRIFDPTQAYSSDRVDKGLAEALMLKRAKCTVYLAQETDTFGKDSELASTLAQGKLVIAYVPEFDDELWKEIHVTMEKIYPDNTKEKILLRLLRIFAPDMAWENTVVQQILLGNNEKSSEDELTLLVKQSIKNHYDRRAKTLIKNHPLGLQANLNTGVVNGVLVVRKIENCALLIRKIILNQLRFYIEDKNINGQDYSFLHETETNCVFRVMSGDKLLTNCFWNFYEIG
jgi:hypothetical protein